MATLPSDLTRSLRTALKNENIEFDETVEMGFGSNFIMTTKFIRGMVEYKIRIDSDGYKSITTGGNGLSKEIRTNRQDIIIQFVICPDKYRLVFAQPTGKDTSAIIEGVDVAKD